MGVHRELSAITSPRPAHLPIGGATVTFSIMGGRATFPGGVSQLTVTTDAAGRAAASALNPVSSGQVSIRIEAAFQGQTATATVSQTNVATAAEAARLANSPVHPAGVPGQPGRQPVVARAAADRFLVRYEGQVLFDSGCVKTTRPETRLRRYAGASSRISVQVMPDCSGGTGSTWAIDVACAR